MAGSPSTAFENATGIINWEKSSGLFVETSIQEWVLNHIHLAEALNYFYMYGHWTITPLFFIWLYRRRHSVYPYVRNAFLAANGIALIVFMVYPVAPPRLVGDGFVDTLDKISDIDLHGGVLSGWFNPHAAVPSMHFGYALMIGAVGFVLLRSWPLRLIAHRVPGRRLHHDHGDGEPLRARRRRGRDRDRHGLRRGLGAHAGLPARPHAPRAGPRQDALDHLDPLTAGRLRGARPAGSMMSAPSGYGG